MLSKIRILIENTPRSVTIARWDDSNFEGIGTFAVCGRTIDFSLMGLNVIAKLMGSPNSHITPWLVFYATGIVLLLYRPINRFYILTAAEGR